MDTFLIDVPMPSMGATVNELTVVSIKLEPGVSVSKGLVIAELESDKSVFAFESPCDGVLKGILAKPGDVRPAGTPFLRIQTGDVSLKHLESKGELLSSLAPAHDATKPQAIWTPKATKVAQEAGLDPSTLLEIEATGPGGRVSGDDVARYIAKFKK